MSKVDDFVLELQKVEIATDSDVTKSVNPKNCITYCTRSKRTDEEDQRSFVVVQFEDGQCGIVLIHWLVSLDKSWRTSWRKAK